MTAFDIIVLLIIGVSLLRGWMRGMVDTLFSMAAWFVAFIVGKWGAVVVAPMLPTVIASTNIRYFVAFALVFLVVLVGVLLVGHLVATTVRGMGLGGADKALGGVVGLLKGSMIVIGFTLVAGLTSLPRTKLWQSAVLSNSLEAVALRVMPFLPARFTKYVKFT